MRGVSGFAPMCALASSSYFDGCHLSHMSSYLMMICLKFNVWFFAGFGIFVCLLFFHRCKTASIGKMFFVTCFGGEKRAATFMRFHCSLLFSYFDYWGMLILGSSLLNHTNRVSTYSSLVNYKFNLNNVSYPAPWCVLLARW